MAASTPEKEDVRPTDSSPSVPDEPTVIPSGTADKPLPEPSQELSAKTSATNYWTITFRMGSIHTHGHARDSTISIPFSAAVLTQLPVQRVVPLVVRVELSPGQPHASSVALPSKPTHASSHIAHILRPSRTSARASAFAGIRRDIQSPASTARASCEFPADAASFVLYRRRLSDSPTLVSSAHKLTPPSYIVPQHKYATTSQRSSGPKGP